MIRASRLQLILACFVVAASGATARAAPPPATPATAPASGAAEDTRYRPEVIGMKAYLEDLLIRRYSQELATTIDRAQFSMGAQLMLDEVPRTEAKKPDPLASLPETAPDLLLGNFDPEEQLRKLAPPEVASEIRGFFSKYRVRSVQVSVGVKDELGSDARTQVEKWLKERLDSEFGGAAKGVVTAIQLPPEKSQVPKTPWDRLNQFQQLAGQLALALAILLFAILWKVLGSSSTQSASDGTGAGAGLAVAPAGGPKIQETKIEEKKSDVPLDPVAEIPPHVLAENQRLTEQIASLSKRILIQLEPIIRSWCQTGENGKLKLACFAEAMAAPIGKLPIPVDFAEGLTQAFGKMAELSALDKRGILRRIHTDLLQAMNLGHETLAQPFGYLADFDANMTSHVLMEQDPKMKALVSLFMPPELRKSYFATLTPEVKRQLLETAGTLVSVEKEELRSIEGGLVRYVTPDDIRSKVTLDGPIRKLVSSLTPLEEIELLQGMKGPAYTDYKTTTPTLAFLAEWPDESVRLFLSRAMPDEVVALIRALPEQRARLMPLCAQMTAEVAADELSRPDTMRVEDKNRLLSSLVSRLKVMADRGDIRLADLYPHEKKSVENQDAGKSAPQAA